MAGQTKLSASSTGIWPDTGRAISISSRRGTSTGARSARTCPRRFSPVRTARLCFATMFRPPEPPCRSEEHTSELQSLMRISYAVFCLKKKNNHTHTTYIIETNHSRIKPSDIHTSQHASYQQYYDITILHDN